MRAQGGFEREAICAGFSLGRAEPGTLHGLQQAHRQRLILLDEHDPRVGVAAIGNSVRRIYC